MSCAINKHTVKNIVLQIVQAYPYSDFKTPNAFAVVNGFDDMMTSNLGKGFEDYLNGSFWARDWEANGSDSNELKREFPLVLLESTEISIEDGKECRRYALTVVSQHSCNTCERTKEQVSCDTENMLKVILREMSNFALFGSDDVDIWLNKNFAESNGHEDKGKDFDYLEGQDLKLFEISRNMPNLIGWSVQFEIVDCIDLDDVVFNYTTIDTAKSVGINVCEDC